MLKKSIVSAKNSRPWQGIPAIERAANGRLWSAFFSGGPEEPHPDNYILLTTSQDDGQTWAEPMKFLDRPGATRVYDPALWHDPAGQLWLFFNQANLETKEFTLWAMTTRESGQARPTWSEPRELDFRLPFAFRLNKPTVLTSGEWLLPVTWASTPPTKWFHFPPGQQLQGVAISQDQGRHWSFHGAVEAPPWALENMILEKTDGTLLMLIRTGGGVLWQSASSDRGRTWAKGLPTTIVNPGSRFFLRRLASGRVLLINSPHAKERTALHARLSALDDGTGFGPPLELDSRPKISYPDAVQAPDGTIYATYDHDRYGVGEICFCAFTEADIPQPPK